ncbi:MAG: hypothetical protein QW220_06045 [Candidatus Bathyarchaeia archaeon]
MKECEGVRFSILRPFMAVHREVAKSGTTFGSTLRIHSEHP